MKNKKLQRVARHKRVKRKIFNPVLPRLVVFRSNRHIYGQLIDDQKSITIAAASDMKSKSEANKIQKAKEVGKTLAQEGQKKKIKDVVFDRGGYKYHGRVKALAEGAREGGLVF